MAYDLSVLDQGCREMGIVLNGEQRQQFVDFYEYLVEKNKVMNLTGITEFQEVLVKHFLDSLACVKAVDIKKVKRMMDVGTGAGFPGVFTEEQKNMQKTKPTEKALIFAYQEQYPIWQLFLNTACPM